MSQFSAVINILWLRSRLSGYGAIHKHVINPLDIDLGISFMNTPSLAVLMATFQGEEWLRPQLDSFTTQTLQPDLILTSDDGSTDATVSIYEEFATANPNIVMRRIKGPGKGSADNFLSLIVQAPGEIDRVAFADQDDVWLPEKLARASIFLDEADAIDAGRPSLYCGRISVCNSALTACRSTQVPRRGPSFRNALTQNIVTGHTIVLNRAAFELARAAIAMGSRAVFHDWWLYQLITGADGRILFDAGPPQVLYRQHETNLIGINSGLRARLRRLNQLWDGTYEMWNAINLESLGRIQDMLTPENARLVSTFKTACSAGAIKRVRTIRHLGLHRQGFAGQTSLYVAALMGKI